MSFAGNLTTFCLLSLFLLTCFHANVLGKVNKQQNNSTRPPTNSTRPPTNSTRPPTNSTRPPTNSTRPPTNSTRPPTNSTQPPSNKTSNNPAKAVLAEFTRLAHDLRSGNVTVLNSRTFSIPKLYYDGKGPDAYFFLGTGALPVDGKPMKRGTKIPNEAGSFDVLKKYTGQSITLKVQSPLDIAKFNWLCIWCVKFTHLFGYVLIPEDLNVPPASKKS